MTGWTLDDVRALAVDDYEVLVEMMNAEAKKKG